MIFPLIVELRSQRCTGRPKIDTKLFWNETFLERFRLATDAPSAEWNFSSSVIARGEPAETVAALTNSVDFK